MKSDNERGEIKQKERENLVKIEGAKMAATREEQGERVDNLNSTIWNAEHPLLNPLVISNILEVVELRDLRSFRLVCQDWYSASLPIWRRNVQLNIYTRTYGRTPPPRSLLWESLGRELDDVAGEKPFRRFRLHSTQFRAAISKPRIIGPFSYATNMNAASFEGTYRNMRRFWGDYGHWIHKLEMKDVFVTDLEAFKRAIFEQTPNLQELTLDRVIDRRDAEARNPLPAQGNEDEGPVQPNLNLKAFAMMDRYHKLPFGWRLFFTRFPNIEKLDLTELYERSDSDEMVECLENMLTSPACRTNLPITDLRLEAFWDSPFEKLLRNPLVKLKVLHLHLRGHSDNIFDTLRTVMRHQGNTMKELHLENNYARRINIWESVVGPYPSLTELQIKGAALAFNFHFLNKLPNLKILRLEQSVKDKMLRGTDWTALEIMPRLQEFCFIVPCSEDDVLSEEMLERLAEIMPNLQSFTGQLTNLALRVVCRNWGQLKKLVILSGRNFNPMDLAVGATMDIDDVGITGIVPGSDERVPCVADLQELRHLSLQHVTKIGDASVFDGFLKLPHLSSLNICDATEILEGLDVLRSRFQGVLTITPLKCLE